MLSLGAFDAQPNQADWSAYIEVIDDDTGTAWDLSATLIEIEVRDPDNCRRLYGSTTDGTVVVVGDGFEFSFPASQMSHLCAGPYIANIRLTDNDTGYVAEPVIAVLPVLDGGFR